MVLLRPRLLNVFLVWIWVSLTCAHVPKQALPGCQSYCGNFTIPYPFGLGEGCYVDKGFEILCQNRSSMFVDNTTFRPFLGANGVEVTELSLNKVKVLWQAPAIIRSWSSTSQMREIKWLNLTGSPFTFSSTDNKLLATGCGIFAYLSNSNIEINMTGCVSICGVGASGAECSGGDGCCSTSIPTGLKAFHLWLESINTHNRSFDRSNYIYIYIAAVAEEVTPLVDGFESGKDVTPTGFQATVSLNWAIGEQTCKEARRRDGSNFRCGNHSQCIDSINGPGLRCRCLEGYQGNPYLPHGCEDINECEGPNKCMSKAKCSNALGDYNCTCPSGHHGDGKRDGSGCTPGISQTKVVLTAHED